MQSASNSKSKQVIKLQAVLETTLSNEPNPARLSAVALSALGPKNSRSKKLKDTLCELESALSSWDQIMPSGLNLELDRSAPQANPSSGRLPEEMKRRTRALLDLLKEQIDELSAES